LRPDPLAFDFELLHEIPEFIDANADQVRTDFARVDVSELHPFLELRFADGQKLARALQIEVAGEFMDPTELIPHRITHGADQNVIGNFEAEHAAVAGFTNRE
jgi:hypothetical protein